MRVRAGRAWRVRSVWCATACASLAATGCVPVPDPVLSAGLSAAQAGTSAFIQGELRAVVRVPIREVYDATVLAMGEQGLRFEVRVADFRGGSAVLTCRETAGDERGGNDRVVEIILRKSTAVVTTVSIQSGTFGDQPLSRLVLDEIHRRLPVAAGSEPGVR